MSHIVERISFDLEELADSLVRVSEAKWQFESDLVFYARPDSFEELKLKSPIVKSYYLLHYTYYQLNPTLETQLQADVIFQHCEQHYTALTLKLVRRLNEYMRQKISAVEQAERVELFAHLPGLCPETREFPGSVVYRPNVCEKSFPMKWTNITEVEVHRPRHRDTTMSLLAGYHPFDQTVLRDPVTRKVIRDVDCIEALPREYRKFGVNRHYGSCIPRSALPGCEMTDLEQKYFQHSPFSKNYTSPRAWRFGGVRLDSDAFEFIIFGEEDEKMRVLLETARKFQNYQAANHFISKVASKYALRLIQEPNIMLRFDLAIPSLKMLALRKLEESERVKTRMRTSLRSGTYKW